VARVASLIRSFSETWIRLISALELVFP